MAHEEHIMTPKIGPPADFEGSLVEWAALTAKQRMDIRGVKGKGGGQKPVLQPPASFSGSVVEWKKLTAQQRYKLKNNDAAYRIENEVKITARNVKRLAKRKEYSRKNQVKISAMYKEYHKEYYKRNHVEIQAYQTGYYHKNKVVIQAQQTEYRGNNKVKIQAQQKEHRCKQAATWWEKHGSAEAISASRAALALEQNHDKPWAATYARDRATEASFEAVGGV